jgi:hypothetical protein
MFFIAVSVRSVMLIVPKFSETLICFLLEAEFVVAWGGIWGCACFVHKRCEPLNLTPLYVA